jgi:hypothetical protein
MDIGLMENFEQKRTWTTLAIVIAILLLGLQFALLLSDT